MNKKRCRVQWYTIRRHEWPEVNSIQWTFTRNTNNAFYRDHNNEKKNYKWWSKVKRCPTIKAVMIRLRNIVNVRLCQTNFERRRTSYNTSSKWSFFVHIQKISILYYSTLTCCDRHFPSRLNNDLNTMSLLWYS